MKPEEINEELDRIFGYDERPEKRETRALIFSLISPPSEGPKCWNCGNDYTNDPEVDCMDATCYRCHAPYDKKRCKEFGFKPKSGPAPFAGAFGFEPLSDKDSGPEGKGE